MELKGLEKCWLSPKGIIITGDREFEGLAWHEDLACCILRDIWGMTEKLDAFEKVHEKYNGSSTGELENLGWMRLHCTIEPIWVLSSDRRLTKSQENTILDWCIENNKSFNTCFNK